MLSIVQEALAKILGKVLIRSQLSTVIALVAGLLDSEQAGIAAIGRHLPGDALAKSKMNRVYRFVSNPRIEVGCICEAMMRALVLTGKVVVATDWTLIGDLWVLASAVVTHGRAIPLYWTVVDESVTRLKSVEVEHMRKLAQMLAGAEVDAVHVLDRGFDCGAFLKAIGKFCKYVVRASKGFLYRRTSATEYVNIDDFPIKRGRCHDLGEVDYTKAHGTRCRLVLFHDHQQKDQWLLATNIYGEKRRRIVEYYARRFRIEESFKDLKDLRSGFGLHGYRMEKPEHLSRLLVIAALGYLLVTASGHKGEENGLHRGLQINTRTTRELASWRVGLYGMKKTLVSAGEILDCLSLLALYCDEALAFNAFSASGTSPTREEALDVAT